jgi:hypothetical protein
MPRIAPVFCLAVTVALSAPAALAGPATLGVAFASKGGTAAKKQVAVGKITGPNAAKVRVLVMKAIKDSGWYDVADAEDLKPTDSKKTIAKLSGVLAVDGVVMGSVSKRVDLTLAVYKANGQKIDEVVVKGGSLQKLEAALANEFKLTIAPPLADATGGYKPDLKEAPPSEMEEEAEPDLGSGGAAAPDEAEAAGEEGEPEPADAEPSEDAPAEDAEDAEEKPDKSGPSKAGRSPFEFIAAVRGYSRSFNYTDPVGQRDRTPPPAGPRPRNLVPYKLPFGPALKLGARIYPGAFVRDDIASYFGAVANFDFGFATGTDLEEKQSDGSTKVTRLETASTAWDAGIRARVPVGPLELGLTGTYGSHSFILYGDEGGAGLEPLVPDVRYDQIRIGGDIRARISKLLVGAHVAHRQLLSLHQIDLAYVWFPGAKGRGLDLGLELGWEVLPFLDVVGGVDFMRYGFDFNGLPAEPTPCGPAGCRAPVIAGGATDTYISGWLGAMLTLGGPKK